MKRTSSKKKGSVPQKQITLLYVCLSDTRQKREISRIFWGEAKELLNVYKKWRVLDPKNWNSLWFTMEWQDIIAKKVRVYIIPEVFNR